VRCSEGGRGHGRLDDAFPTYLAAVAEWAGAAVTMLAVGKIRQTSGERR